MDEADQPFESGTGLTTLFEGEWALLLSATLSVLWALWGASFLADFVPAELWRQWLDRLELREPFPPDAFIQAPKTKRRAALAEALGVSRDVIYQRWLRLKQKLQSQVHSA